MTNTKRKAGIAAALLFAAWLTLDLSAGWLASAQGIAAGDYYLNSFELLSAKYKAKKGDVQSISRLVDYYSIYKLDETEAKYWAKVASDKGDPQFQKLLQD